MTYDLIVIGSGPGGYVAAIRAAQLGLKVACVEKDKTLGGTCLNVGCIPSKALLHSSELYSKCLHETAANGIEAKASYDFAKMMQRKTDVVSSFNRGIEMLFKKNKVEWVQGLARLNKDGKSVSVNGKTLEAKYILLASGSVPIQLPFLPFDEKKVVSSTGALALAHVPKKLLIIGAGVIGVELGSVYRRLGADVVFLEFLDRICPAFDMAVSKALQKSLTAQGMVFHLSHKAMSAKVGKTVELTAQGPSGEIKLDADVVLVAVGRKPFSEGLGLEEAGIKKDAKGYVEIDNSFRTSLPHVFAIGDLVNGPMLAHKASEEGVAAVELIAGLSPVIDYAAIPNVAYTFPEVASVGFSEEELKTKGVAYKAAQFPFKANSRARCTGEDEGFVKMIAAADTKRILGIHIFGPNASEMIAAAAIALHKRMTAEELGDTCFAHPTLSEALKEAALSLSKGAIHM